MANNLRVLSETGRELLQQALMSADPADPYDGAPCIVAYDPLVTIRWAGDTRSEYMVRYWEKGQENNPLLGVDYEPPQTTAADNNGLLLRGEGPHTCRLSAWGVGDRSSIPPGTTLVIYVMRRDLGFQETMWNRGGWEFGDPIEVDTKAREEEEEEEEDRDHDDTSSPLMGGGGGAVRGAVRGGADGDGLPSSQATMRVWAAEWAEGAGNAYTSSAVQEMKAATQATLDEVARSTQRTLDDTAAKAQGVASTVKTAAGSAAVLLDREDGARQVQDATRTFVRGAVVNAASAAPRVARMGGSLAAGVAAIPTAVETAVHGTVMGGVNGGIAGAKAGASMGDAVVGNIGAVGGGVVGALHGAQVGGVNGLIGGTIVGAGIGGTAGVVVGAAVGGAGAGGIGAVVVGAYGGAYGVVTGGVTGAVVGGVGGVVVGGVRGGVRGAKAGRLVGGEIGKIGGEVIGGAVGAVGGTCAGARQGVRSGYDDIANGAEEGGKAAEEATQAWVDQGADVVADYVGILAYNAADSAGSIAAATVELGGVVTARSASEASARVSTYAATQQEYIRETASALSENMVTTNRSAGATAGFGLDELGKTSSSTIAGLGSYLRGYDDHR